MLGMTFVCSAPVDIYFTEGKEIGEDRQNLRTRGIDDDLGRRAYRSSPASLK